VIGPVATNDVGRLTGETFESDFTVSWTWTQAKYGFIGVYDAGYDAAWTGTSMHGGILYNAGVPSWSIQPSNGGLASIYYGQTKVGTIADPAGHAMEFSRVDDTFTISRDGVTVFSYAAHSHTPVRLFFGSHDSWANTLTDLTWSEPVTVSDNDTLLGGAGNDILTGGAGNDTLTGGTGDDKFVFSTNLGQATVFDFTPDHDTIDVSAFGIATFGVLMAASTDVGADVQIALGVDHIVTLKNTHVANLHSGDFII